MRKGVKSAIVAGIVNAKEKQECPVCGNEIGNVL